MKPFYQGKIDTFCAIYAVLNVLRRTNGIRTLKAREIFNNMLMSLVASPSLFQQVLQMTTDYVRIVDSLLTYCSRLYPISVERPFASDDVEVDAVWERLMTWCATKEQGTGVLRFLRYVNPTTDPCIRHWTTIGSIDAESLHLYDCSHEADAIAHIQRTAVVTRLRDVVDISSIHVQASSIRLVCLR